MVDGQIDAETSAGRRVSIRELAQRLGVSVATVSKVLNDAPDSRVSAGTAARIRELAEQLHYVPAAAARQLRRRRAESIAVVVPILNLFFVGLVEAIERRALEHGYTAILVCNREDSNLERRHLDLALAGKVDGLIVVPARRNQNHDLYAAIRQRGIPLIFVDRYLPGVPADYIGVENERGAYLATRHLIASGTGCVGIVCGDDDRTSMRERIDGYSRGVTEVGLPVVKLEAGPPRSFHEAITRHSPPIGGVFWLSYLNLQSQLQATLAAGIDPPVDLRFAGFDSLFISAASEADYRVARLLAKPLPTVIQPIGEMGRRAVDQLVARLSGDSSARVHVSLPLGYFGIDAGELESSAPVPRSVAKAAS